MEKRKINKFNGEIIFLSYFSSGFFPKAPGTFASALTIPLIYWLGKLNLPLFFFIPFLVTTTIFTCFITDHVQKKYELHDPGWIVMDEVLGMLTTWLFYRGSGIKELLLIFILFRIFDIFKIWPATFFDKKVHHGSGTILDDIVSGIYAGASFLLINYYLL